MLFNSFTASEGYSKQVKQLIKKVIKGAEINLFYPSGFANENFYHLFQLIEVAKFSKYNVNFHILLSDLELYTKRHTHYVEQVPYKPDLVNVYISEIKKVMVKFGCNEERLHFYRMSELLPLLFRNERMALLFYEGLTKFSDNILEIPEEFCKRYYLQKNSTYTISYIIRKYSSMVLGAYLNDLLSNAPKIDLFIESDGGVPVNSRLRHMMLSNKLIPQTNPVFLKLPAIPCCGHSKHVGGKQFCIPDWNMQPHEIYKVLKEYSFSNAHAKELLTHFLAHYLNEFLVPNKGAIIKTNKLPNLSRLGTKAVWNLLAYNLHYFLTNLKKEVHSNTQIDMINLRGEEKILSTAKLLKRRLALDVLKHCSGELSVSELARKLDKHSSNVCAVLGHLKKAGLIDYVNGKPKKIVETIKISL